ncbi:MAG: hypothetical protein QXX94_07530 [Candidatus Bathyarchaeia archaeon]
MRVTLKHPLTLIISVVSIISVAVIYMLFFMQSAYEIEILSAECIVETYGWRIVRTIKVDIRNPGDENVTVSGVLVDEKSWNQLSPTNLLIPPKSVRTIKIFYPWNSVKYSVTIETDKGKKKVDVDAPNFSSLKAILQNLNDDEWNSMISFDFIFGDGELEEPKMAVYKDGAPIICQVWGIVRYESGYIKSATISFPASIPARGESSYMIRLNEEGLEENNPLNLDKSSGFVLINNGVIKVRFNENEGYRGEIDWVGDVNNKINYAKVFGIFRGSRHDLKSGLLTISLVYWGPMTIINSDNFATYIESNGPLLAVYARKWKMQSDLGWAYEFYAVPHNNPIILYKVFLDVNREFNMGPGAAPGSGYEIYNPYGTGYLAIPLLIVKNASFFITDLSDIYHPPWPGSDLWAKHPVAACINATHAVAITRVCNDPVIPIEYWHITTERWFTGFEWPWNLEYTGEENVWTDHVAVVGVPEGKLCWTGQDLSREPYAIEREITPRGTLTLRVGRYSWIFHVEVIVEGDVTHTLYKLVNTYSGVDVNVEVYP